MKYIAKFILVILALALFLSSCETPTTGIKGKVVLAKCTGSQVATKCTALSIYSASLTLYNDKLERLKTYKTHGDGSFSISLKAGTYYVHPEPAEPGKFPMAADFKVVVTKDKMTDLTIYYDTGVRENIPTPTE
jgi:hypothetical protein